MKRLRRESIFNPANHNKFTVQTEESDIQLSVQSEIYFRQVRINNVSCFVLYKHERATKTCVIQVFNRLRPHPLTFTLSGCDPVTFDID